MSSGNNRRGNRDGGSSLWAVALVGLATAAVGFFAGMMAAQPATVEDTDATRRASSRLDPSTCQAAQGDEPTCPVCMDNRQDCVLGPCNHVVCQRCSTQLAECPMCRTRVRTRERLFLS
jgi:hypothetical protein